MSRARTRMPVGRTPMLVPVLALATSLALLVAAGAPALATSGPQMSQARAVEQLPTAVPRPDDDPVATSPVDTVNPCDRTVTPPPGADGTTCMLPFPNNLFTTGTGTDRRLNLPAAGMPKDAAGKPINPEPYRASDGFSPGQLLIVKVPGLDNPEAFTKTGSVPITDMQRYLDPAAPVVVIDVQTGERHPIWTEIDVNPLGPLPQGSAAGLVTGEAADQTDQEAPPADTGPPRPQNTANVQLLIRPAKNFVNGHRYVVGLRGLKDAAGEAIQATPGFTFYRDPTGLTAADPRSERYEKDVFPVLADAGLERGSLYQAWDFSVASATNIAGRLLHMRDDTFAELGDTDLADRRVDGDAPPFTVSELTKDDEGVRTVTGTITVPCYIDTPNCAPGGQFRFDPVNDPDQQTPLRLPGNVTTADFTCKIPSRVYDSPTLEKVRPSLYGHGLLGGQGEVGQGQVKAMLAEHGFMYCAADWEGFATGDIPTVAQALADMDRFPAVIDHTQQGELNFLLLARLMIHPEGFPATEQFQVDKGAGLQSFIDTTRAYYDGNSQGGIYGGTVMAIAPDVDRGVLGVPGINYSTLLRRSVDFALYSLPLYTAYPSEYERPLLLSVIQILWDRGDPNGYVNSLAPGQQLPNTPPHEVMFQVGFGDHQVANVTADSAARTVGASVDPAPLEAGRSPDVTPVWGVPRIASYPHKGSGIVYFDIGAVSESNPRGTSPPPTANVPPNAEGDTDPHEAPRNSACGRVMKSNFLRPDGVVTNPCLGAPYFAFDYQGADGKPGQGDTVQPGDAKPYDPSSPGGTSGSPGGYHPLQPARVLDTRDGDGPVRAGSDRSVGLLGKGGLPTSGVRAVVVNATVTEVSRRMDLSVFPTGGQPSTRTSNVNAVAGQTVANLVTTSLGSGGAITLSTSAGATEVVLDVLGWYDDGTAPAGDGYVAVTPDRRFDSRDATKIAAGADRVVDLLPASVTGASAAVVNVTGVNAGSNADLSVFAAGGKPARRTSTLNLRRGQAVANLALVPVDDQGRVALSVSQGSMDVALDLLGYYTADSAGTFTAVGPERTFDTRTADNAVQVGKDREVVVLGKGGVPASGVEAVLMNVTSTQSSTRADLQVYPAGAKPERRTSSLNVRAGQDVPALVLAKVGRDGKVVLSTSQGEMHVVFDVLGWVAAG